MGSLFSAPKVTNRATKNAINSASNAASSASSNINSTANSAADSLTQLGGNLNQYYQPINYNAGGLTGTYTPGQGYTVTADPARQALVNQLYGGYNDAATAFGNLRSQWTPGESALRAAQLQSIENARQANISDLRQNLAKRAVLGSSFAQDAQTRANLDYENQKNNVISQTYLQELDAQHQLIGDQYTAAANAVSSKINELNLEGNLGTQLTSQAQDALKSYAQLQAQLATDAAQLKVTGATNAGQILTNNKTSLAGTQANLSADQAKLDAQAQQGAGNLLGTLALAPLTGGTSLLGAGLNLASGNQAFPQAPSFYTGSSILGTGGGLLNNSASNGYFYTPATGSNYVYQ